jgi:hypothetical protein
VGAVKAVSPSISDRLSLSTRLRHIAMLSFPMDSHSAGEPTVHGEKDTRRKEEPHIARRPAVSSRSVATPEMQPGNGNGDGPWIRRQERVPRSREGLLRPVHLSLKMDVFKSDPLGLFDPPKHPIVRFMPFFLGQPTPFEMKTRPFPPPSTPP